MCVRKIVHGLRRFRSRQWAIASMVRVTARIKSPSATAPALHYLLHPCSRHSPSGHLLPQSGRRKFNSNANGCGGPLLLGCAGCAVNGPPERRRSDGGKPEGWAQWIAPSLASVQGWTVDKPRSHFANSEGRKPVERRFGVAFLWAIFLWPRKERWLARWRRVKNGRDAALRRSVLSKRKFTN